MDGVTPGPSAPDDVTALVRFVEDVAAASENACQHHLDVYENDTRIEADAALGEAQKARASAKMWRKIASALAAQAQRIETLVGAMAASDERLRQAEARVWPDVTWGCDAPEHMADEILTLRERIETLTASLAECYRLTGADPDGNEDWRLARDAVNEVRRLREESEADVARLEAERDEARKG